MPLGWHKAYEWPWLVRNAWKKPLSSLFPLYICHQLPQSESQELTLCQVPAGMFLLLWPLKLLTFAKTWDLNLSVPINPYWHGTFSMWQPHWIHYSLFFSFFHACWEWEQITYKCSQFKTLVLCKKKKKNESLVNLIWLFYLSDFAPQKCLEACGCIPRYFQASII